MAKYGVYSRRPPGKRRLWEVHPIWRGIGCFLIILIPILSWASAVLLVRENRDRGWLAIPPELLQSVTLPLLGRIDSFPAIIVLTILLTLAAFVLLTVLYSLVFRLFGPPQYGPMDAPPMRRRK